MKKIRNVDGLQKPKKHIQNLNVGRLKMQVDAIRPSAALPRPYVIQTATVFPQARRSPSFSLAEFLAVNRTAAVAALGVIVAFSLGVGYAASTPRSAADSEVPVLAMTRAASAPIPLADAPAGVSAPKDELFNTPLELLQSYLSSAAPDIVTLRKDKLRQFLKERNSPLEPNAGLIAEQDHWKLILAISFAESTLGKHCFANNCSGIGGSNIRTYKSLDNWILDFNRLLENRYKGDTLEEMCGVYVQPCNPNWLVATKQILSALEEAKIE
jgi:hypothetical protein